METVLLLEVTAYLDIYDIFFLFKKKVSTASDNSTKNKIRKRVEGKDKEEYMAGAFCQDTRIMKFGMSSRHDPYQAKNYFQLQV